MSDTNIVLSFEELLAQSQNMHTLKEEYDGMFNQVLQILNEMNEGWSENLANNFVGKISTAQKGFSRIVEMLECGESVAREAAQSMEDINAVMARTQSNSYAALFSSAMSNFGSIMDQPITSEMYEAALERINNGTFSKQDVLIANGGGFNTGINRDMLGTLSEAEQAAFGTDYLGTLENILNGTESLGEKLENGGFFENAFDRIGTQWDRLEAVLSGNVNSETVDPMFAEYYENIAGVQDTIAEGNLIEAGIQSQIYSQGLVNAEIVDGLFSSLEDNLELGKVAADFLGLGKYGDMVDSIQTGIQDVTGMDLSEIGDYLSDGINNIYTDIGDGVPVIMEGIQDFGEAALTGVGNAFEDIGGFFGNLF